MPLPWPLAFPSPLPHCTALASALAPCMWPCLHTPPGLSDPHPQPHGVGVISASRLSTVCVWTGSDPVACVFPVYRLPVRTTMYTMTVKIPHTITIGYHMSGKSIRRSDCQGLRLLARPWPRIGSLGPYWAPWGPTCMGTCRGCVRRALYIDPPTAAG